MTAVNGRICGNCSADCQTGSRLEFEGSRVVVLEEVVLLAGKRSLEDVGKAVMRERAGTDESSNSVPQELRAEGRFIAM